MKVVVAPDSFKGSLAATEVCRLVAQAFAEVAPEVQLLSVPMADGGEGTLDCLVTATAGRLRSLTVADATGKPTKTVYGVLGRGETAVIEVARMIGLTSLPSPASGILNRGTLGVGQAVKAALDAGHRHIVLSLGGSSTNDGGMGMLAALGVGFYDADGNLLPPVANSLMRLQHIDTQLLDGRLKASRLTVAGDVTNPLCGPAGSSVVFAPQKGATAGEVEVMDEALGNYADSVEAALGGDWRNCPGAGAAGGLGFAALALGGEIVSGAGLVADLAHLPEKLQNADFVITGEGRTDAQTLRGKVPFVVAQLARDHGAKTLLLSGSVDSALAEDDLFAALFAKSYSLVSSVTTVEEAMAAAPQLLLRVAAEIAQELDAAARF